MAVILKTSTSPLRRCPLAHSNVARFLVAAGAPVDSSHGDQVPGGGRIRRGFEMRRLGGPPLPLPCPPHPRPPCNIHIPLFQVPSLLPRAFPLPLPRPSQAQVPAQPVVNPSSRRHFCAAVGAGPDPADPAAPEAVDRVCRVVDDLFASDRNMEAVLDQAGVEPSPALVAAVLDRFRHAHRPAYRFFRWAASKPGFVHDPAVYNTMLSVLGVTRQFETLAALLDEMARRRLLTPDSLRIAVTAFAAAREMKKAVWAFRLMERSGLDAGISAFNALLLALANQKLGREAQGLFDRMRDRYEPDLRTYTVLLLGWCKVKNLVEAGRVWNEMVDMGLKPDAVAHNTMMGGLIRGQRRPEAIKLFELMKAKGPQPTVCTYNILIDDFCKHGRLDSAVDCFREMVDVGIQPDAETYTSLILGFGKAKRMQDVSGLLTEMHDKGCPPDGHTYNALIKLMTIHNMPDHARKVYKRMIKNGIAPTLHAFNMMMKAYFRANNLEMGRAVWDEMRERGVCPDDNSYTVLISGLIRYGRSDEALKYLEEMMSKGMKAPRFDYHKFAADFRRYGNPDVLYELAQKLNFSGMPAASDVFMSLVERREKVAQQRGYRQYGRER